ncbi:TVP38/TMEM64 family protein [Chitinimonas sp. BJB300]|uniref:TVP38/TMEM64 family protein n=1 Tax=Chitinimonas sp. BJB300 TaxID=1559339 RepID=UPI001304458C|nr:VTT domain-containing protein [Chitinimonas sp. BJB300]
MAEAPDALPGLRRRRRVFLLLLAVLLLLGIGLQWTPARHWLSLTTLSVQVQHWGDQLGPVVTVLCFALACALAVPLSVLAVVTALAFGPVFGAVYAWLGATLGAWVSFMCGRWLGQAAVAQLAGPKLNHISQQLARRGVISVIAIRMVPVAPYAVINLVAGASAIRLRDFLLGNAVGILPLLLISALFSEQILRAANQPVWLTVLLAVLFVALVVAGTAILRRWWRDG